MNHMPGHIYVLCGQYQRALDAKAVTRTVRSAATTLYAPDYAGSMNFYVTARCHDLHLLMFACHVPGSVRARHSPPPKRSSGS